MFIVGLIVLHQKSTSDCLANWAPADPGYPGLDSTSSTCNLDGCQLSGDQTISKDSCDAENSSPKAHHKKRESGVFHISRNQVDVKMSFAVAVPSGTEREK